MTLFIILGFQLLCGFLVQANGQTNTSTKDIGGWEPQSFNNFYNYLWGSDHFWVNRKGSLVTLKFDRTSGAGFRSKLEFGYGIFTMQMKIPSGKTGGIVTNFYMTSAPDNQPPGNHFEIDFEFLGTNGTLQTNVYDKDTGSREQSFDLWFDPKADLHTYQFVWNPYHILFVIDGIIIREFKNNKQHGVAFPDTPMHIEASVWNADWAGAVDWSHAPFVASYSGFSIDACVPRRGDIAGCGSDKYFWNRSMYRSLNTAQRQKMLSYRKRYMTYNYCWKSSTKKKECSFNDALLKYSTAVHSY